MARSVNKLAKQRLQASSSACRRGYSNKYPVDRRNWRSANPRRWRNCARQLLDLPSIVVAILRKPARSPAANRRVRARSTPVHGLSGHFGQIVDIIGVDDIQNFMQAVPGIGLIEQITISLCSNGKSVRHFYILMRQLSIHFSQRSIFTAN